MFNMTFRKSNALFQGQLTRYSSNETDIKTNSLYSSDGRVYTQRTIINAMPIWTFQVHHLSWPFAFCFLCLHDGVAVSNINLKTRFPCSHILQRKIHQERLTSHERNPTVCLKIINSELIARNRPVLMR
jgi:hypothetical protein